MEAFLNFLNEDGSCHTESVQIRGMEDVVLQLARISDQKVLDNLDRLNEANFAELMSPHLLFHSDQTSLSVMAYWAEDLTFLVELTLVTGKNVWKLFRVERRLNYEGDVDLVVAQHMVEAYLKGDVTFIKRQLKPAFGYGRSSTSFCKVK